MSTVRRAALAEVDDLADRLAGYRLWHATRADLLSRLGREPEAIEATRRALAWPRTRPNGSCWRAASTPWRLLHDRANLDPVPGCGDPGPGGGDGHRVVDIVGVQMDEPADNLLQL
jgi:hypothetical protein